MGIDVKVLITHPFTCLQSSPHPIPSSSPHPIPSQIPSASPPLPNSCLSFPSLPKQSAANPCMASGAEKKSDQLAESLNDLFINVSTMVKGELQGTNNLLELLEKMNLRVAEEYKGFGDVASGLRVFMEQLKSKSGSFDEYVQQIDLIERQVTEFEAVISMLDKYVFLLESKVQSVYQTPPP